MHTIDIVKKVSELENIAGEIHDLAPDILPEMPFDEPGYLKGLDFTDTSSIIKQRKAIRKYQSWYASAKQLVAIYAPEWENEILAVMGKTRAEKHGCSSSSY